MARDPQRSSLLPVPRRDKLAESLRRRRSAEIAVQHGSGVFRSPQEGKGRQGVHEFQGIFSLAPHGKAFVHQGSDAHFLVRRGVLTVPFGLAASEDQGLGAGAKTVDTGLENVLGSVAGRQADEAQDALFSREISRTSGGAEVPPQSPFQGVIPVGEGKKPRRFGRRAPGGPGGASAPWGSLSHSGLKYTGMPFTGT